MSTVVGSVHSNPYLIIHAMHLNLAQIVHHNFATTKRMRIVPYCAVLYSKSLDS